MRVKVRSEACQGHSMCVLACPEVFVLDDETGYASTAVDVVPPDLEEAVDLAQRSCPEDAIEILP